MLERDIDISFPSDGYVDLFLWEIAVLRLFEAWGRKDVNGGI